MSPTRMVPEQSYGFWTAVAGLASLLVIALVAIVRDPAGAAAVITAAGAVVGTIVGAFFGVHTGAASGNARAEASDVARRQAEDGRAAAESVKDRMAGGLAKVAATVNPGSETDAALRELIALMTPAAAPGPAAPPSS